MKEKDLNLVPQEAELNRLKGILFPKRSKNIPDTSPTTTQALVKAEPIDKSLRTDIQKLRNQIHMMLEKGRASSPEGQQTERAYLDGINKIAKGLRDYSHQIEDVFDQFIAHLPTSISLDKKNYTNTYFLSMLIQNCTWQKVQSMLKNNKAEGFKAIRQEAEQIKQEQLAQLQIKSERHIRYKSRVMGHMFKFFNRWRFNSSCIGLQAKSQAFNRENNIEYQRIIIQNMLNMPVFVLMLEQISKQVSDCTEILLYDQKTNKLCKFFEEGSECLNTSVETVTQRSLLSDRHLSSKKFKRVEFELRPSLTKICLDRNQIVLIMHLLKHQEYNEIDNPCLVHPSQQNRSRRFDGGMIIYPLLDSHGKIIGLIRQYFAHNSPKYLPNEKLQKISVLLEQGTLLERHNRTLSKEKLYIRQSYYLKMISLIKAVQNAEPNQQSLMRILESELNAIFKTEQLSVYKVQRQQNPKKEIILANRWGKKSSSNQFLLSLVDQFLRRDNNYVYLENRLVVYSNLTLFDITFQETNKNQDGNQLLPVELLSHVLTKVEAIYSKKMQEKALIEINQQQLLQFQLQQQKAFKIKELQSYCLAFLSKSDLNRCPFTQLSQFLAELINKEMSKNGNEQAQGQFVDFFMSVESVRVRKQTKYFSFTLGKWNETFKIDGLINLPGIKINEVANLYVKVPKMTSQTISLIKPCIEAFLSKYLQRSQIPHLNLIPSLLFQNLTSQPTYSLSIDNVDSMKQKKQWELNHIQWIYRTFKNTVQLFASSVFEALEKVEWNKQYPEEGTLQEWKQTIYQFVFNQPEKISISVTNTNPILTVKQYHELECLALDCSQVVEKKSWLSLSIASKPFKIRSLATNDNFVAFALPIYFYLPNQPQQSNSDLQIREVLSKLKAQWINLCRSLIEGCNKIDNNIKKQSLIKIINHMKTRRVKIFRQLFSSLKENLDRQRKKVCNIDKVIRNIESFQMRMKLVSFMRISKYNHRKINTQIHQQLMKNCSKMAAIVSKVIFRHPMHTILQRCVQITKLQNVINKAYSCKISLEIFLKQQAFLAIFYKPYLKARTESAFNTFEELYLKKLKLHFSKLITASTANNLNEAVKPQSIFEGIHTLQQLQDQIKKQTPSYRLYLVIDPLNSFTIYSPAQEEPIVGLEKVNNPQHPWSVYHVGSESQLIWHYQFGENQNNFKIKDKLNNLSKYIEEAMHQCRESTKISLIKLLLTKRKYVQLVKVQYYKRWREATHAICMSERNRLNDSLYQISIESQTIKEKLKMQEKIIKNNTLMYEQLQRKKDQYNNSISFSSERVIKIEESFNKLENTRNLYLSLHRRTVIKSCLLLWRKNSQKIILGEKTAKAANVSLFRMSIKTLCSIFVPKIRRLQATVLKQLSNYKVSQIKQLNVSKIPVNFQQNSDRLITFQSQIQQKENSQHNSNRSNSSSSRSQYKSINKLKLQKIRPQPKVSDLSAEQLSKYSNGAYKLNPKTLKFLKRMGKLES